MLLSHPSDVGSLVGDGREEMPTMTHEHLPGWFSAKIKGTKSDMLLARCFYCSTGMSAGARGPGAGHRTRPGSRQETAGRLGLARSDRAALGVEGAEK